MSDSKVVLHDTPAEVFKQARLLCEIGLDVPQITRMLMALKDLGADVRTDIFTVEEAKRELAVLLDRGGDFS